MAQVNHDVINYIRTVVTQSKSQHIRRPILSIDMIKSFALFCGLNHEYNLDYLDIPVKNVLSVDRADLVDPNMSWLECLHSRIHGNNWSSSAITYFESPMFDNCFSQPNARYRLECLSWNGVIACANGNHRLVAAVCYLAGKYGDDYPLKKVHTRTSTVNADMLLSVNRLIPANCTHFDIAHRTVCSIWWSDFDGIDHILKVDDKYYYYSKRSWLSFDIESKLFIINYYTSDQKRLLKALSSLRFINVDRRILDTMVLNI